MRILADSYKAIERTAANLRSNPSVAHKELGKALWALNVYDLHQYLVKEGVIIDFYHVKSKLAVFIINAVDPSYEPDVDVTRYAQEHKLRLLCVPESACIDKAEDVANKIRRLVNGYQRLRSIG